MKHVQLKKPTAQMSKSAFNDVLRVCKVFGIDFIDLFKVEGYNWNEADARTVIAYLLSTRYGLKDAHIGKILNRHRTSIIEANKRFMRYHEVDKPFREKCDLLKIEIQEKETVTN
ncbi:MAG TPA: hypothetical protein VFC69_07940 [Dysgonamonadaceae bacterium]|nr:hypothetical protein [Dysgonamonadaceae bacterium]